jgi:hypothetical protein
MNRSEFERRPLSVLTKSKAGRSTNLEIVDWHQLHPSIQHPILLPPGAQSRSGVQITIQALQEHVTTQLSADRMHCITPAGVHAVAQAFNSIVNTISKDPDNYRVQR